MRYEYYSAKRQYNDCIKEVMRREMHDWIPLEGVLRYQCVEVRAKEINKKCVARILTSRFAMCGYALIINTLQPSTLSGLKNKEKSFFYRLINFNNLWSCENNDTLFESKRTLSTQRSKVRATISDVATLNSVMVINKRWNAGSHVSSWATYN